MIMMKTANSDQREYWNSASATKWVTLEDELSATHRNVTRALIDAAGIAPGAHVLDIGCGTGASSRAAALAAGHEGHVSAVDISEELLERAGHHGAPADGARIEFLLADAQVHDFPPAWYDAVISQIGIMFFEDPVAGFANLLAATRPGGQITFVCWRRGADNAWFAKAREIAVAHLGDVPDDPDAPGPVAFADEEKVCRLLTKGGWRQAHAERVPIDLTPPGGPAETAGMTTRLGPAARIIRAYQPGQAQIDAIAADIARYLEQFHTREGMRIPVVLNRFTAQTPG